MQLMLKKRIRDSKNSDVRLNITSMMDMFTIILIFLLKSYSVNTVNITPQENLRLPSSTSETRPSEGLGIAVLKDRILLGLSRDGKTIPVLSVALKKELKKARFIAKNNKNYEFKGTIIVQADKSIPFKTLKKIMYTTGVAGYTDFRFAVVSNE